MASVLLVVATTAAAEVPRVVCGGDSITFGWHGHIPGEPGGSYPLWLELLWQGNVSVSNFGVSGVTATANRAYRLTREFGMLLESRFDVAVVMLGTNDAKRKLWNEDEYVESYLALLRLVANSSPRGTLLVGLPPPYLGPVAPQATPFTRSTWGVNSTINELLRNAAARVATLAGMQTIDFFASLGGANADRALYHDAIHPNNRGYKAMATYAFPILSAFLQPFSLRHATPKSRRRPYGVRKRRMAPRQ
ncbi:hypothetical protein CTAYLR_000993 [Chrysophaeum taylorii]|uniref:SGNH hydrolase-type esterase domain-containing protein n=1 Tax=Chrysophaeum taylorii TaxID=2483200 RepID=A0AAD7UF98_9STRA|nr:hypothetical protein CTAYLR_000993 [Chrysophaeum taylorii]